MKISDSGNINKELIEYAISAMEKAYAPYSGFKVGAALLAEDGSVYTGCNVENSSYGASCCAERNAVFKAVSEGKTGFLGIAIAGGPDGHPEGYISPCGICRQVMSEFDKDKKFFVIMAKSKDDYKKEQLKNLMPYAFKL